MYCNLAVASQHCGRLLFRLSILEQSRTTKVLIEGQNCDVSHLVQGQVPGIDWTISRSLYIYASALG